jgi:hypothetical protein
MLKGDPGRLRRGLGQAAERAFETANVGAVATFNLFGIAGASLIGLGQSRWWPAVPVGVVLVVIWLARSALCLRFAFRVKRYFKAKQADDGR